MHPRHGWHHRSLETWPLLLLLDTVLLYQLCMVFLLFPNLPERKKTEEKENRGKRKQRKKKTENCEQIEGICTVQEDIEKHF
jgi:hypothetical protein